MTRYEERKPTTNKFFVQVNSAEIWREVEVKKVVDLEFFGVKIDAFLHKSIKNAVGKWTISEGQAGKRISSGNTMQETVENAIKTFRAVEEHQTKERCFFDIEHDLLSPRYL